MFENIDGIRSLVPDSKRKNRFLSDKEKAADREALKAKLQFLHDTVNESDNVEDLLRKCQADFEALQKQFHTNLKMALDETRELEQSYRTLNLFFENSDEDKISNLTIVNASLEQLTDFDSPKFIEAIKEEINANYDRLDLRDNYSLLVIPGHMASNKILTKWGEIAHENKVLLLTDFEGDSVEDVIEEFKAADLAQADAFRSNVLVSSNWIIARENYPELFEEEILLPPSAALAGRLYASNRISQPNAGKKYGVLKGVDSVQFPLKKSDISELDNIGLIPMVSEFGQVMAFSATTLNRGDMIGMHVYSVVRVFDWISKTLVDFLNRKAFESYDPNLVRSAKTELVKFFDYAKKHGIIQKAKILEFKQDRKTKEIILDFHITPFFPAKTFLISLFGKEGLDGDSPEWDAEYKDLIGQA